MKFKKTLITLSLLLPFTALAQKPEKPKLILQITVDGLRGDLITRFNENMGKGGFNYLLEEGIHYSNANYQHANTETIVGHVSLATGAPPSIHGMVGNTWFERDTNKVVYNIEDANYTLLSENADIKDDTEIDPTMKAANVEGRSPVSILSSTFSDELSTAYNGQSKIFSVSVKDRGAVSLGGQQGKAFWFSKANKNFVTSSYYYQENPTWLNKWNNKKKADNYANKHWELSLPQKEYLFAKEKSTGFKTELGDFSTKFPHPYGPANSDYYSTFLTVSPAGDELTVDLVKEIVVAEQLGKDNIPDYLAVSLSSNDYVIHMFGPSSIEAEDNMLRLDRTLADLFKFIDKKVGLDNTLIVLSADHGASEAPEYLRNLGAVKPEYFSLDTLLNKGIYDKLKAKFGVGKELVESFTHPYIYLNHQAIEKNKLQLADVQRFLAKEVSKIKGIETAVAKVDIESKNLAENRLHRFVINNNHKERSGDIYPIYSSRHYVNDFDGLIVASSHGSPWRYDTHVPIIFAGAKIDNETVVRAVTPYDIAPTLSNYLGITLPSGSTGNVLKEVIDD